MCFIIVGSTSAEAQELSRSSEEFKTSTGFLSGKAVNKILTYLNFSFGLIPSKIWRRGQVENTHLEKMSGWKCTYLVEVAHVHRISQAKHCVSHPLQVRFAKSKVIGCFLQPLAEPLGALRRLTVSVGGNQEGTNIFTGNLTKKSRYFRRVAKT